MRDFQVIFEITGHNIKRWKWRLFSIAVLVAVAFVLHISYAGSMEATIQSNAAQNRSLRLAYDFMVQLAPGERVLGEAEWPRMGTTVRYYSIFESAVEVRAQCGAVSLDLLGLMPESGFFTPEQMELKGRLCADTGEIALPLETAEELGVELGDIITLLAWRGTSGQSNLRRGEYKVVGIYSGLDLAPALVRLEDAEHLYGSKEPNRFLINCVKGFDINRSRTQVYNMMRRAYPKASIIHDGTALEVSRGLQEQIQQPGQNLLTLISVFVCIGVLTIAVMTFLERRKELAALKTIGISNRQIVWMLALEYSLAEGAGLLLGGLTLGMMMLRIDWLRQLPAVIMLRLVAVALLNTLVAVVLALIYPIWTARVATVNQLLYARRIPLGAKRIDHMEKFPSTLVYRERKENLRIVKATAREEAPDMLVLKRVGDRTKAGEVVASQEVMFGFFIREWLAPCDGEVVECSDSGVIAIRPYDPNEKFYPYPVQLLELEQRREEIRLRAAAELRDELKELEATGNKSEGLIAERRFRRARRRQEGDWSVDEERKIQLVDYAAQAREEQRQSKERVGSGSFAPSGWLVPTAIVALCGLFYLGLEMQVRVDHNAKSYGVTVASVMTIQDAIKADGWLFAKEAEQVAVLQSGRVQEVLARNGTYVEAGQPLFVLSDLLLEASYDQAQLNLADARLQYDALRLQSAAGLGSAEVQLLQLQNTVAKLTSDQRSLTLIAPSDGCVVELRAQAGDTLAIGQPLLEFYDATLESEEERQIRLLGAKATLDAAENVLNQLEVKAPSSGRISLVEVVPGQRVEQNELLLGLVKEENSLTAAERLALQQAEMQLRQRREALEQLTVRAPRDGMVSGLNLKAGASVNEGELLARLSANADLLITVAVPQSQIGSVSLGDTAQVTLAHNGFTMSGEVWQIAAVGQTHPTTQAVHFAVEVRLSGDGGAQAGMAATVTLVLEGVPDGKTKPARGVLRNFSEHILNVPVAGTLRELQVQNGDQVREGQIIAVIESESLELSYRQAEAQVEKLRSEELRAVHEATVVEVFVATGETVWEGQTLLRLENKGARAAWRKAKIEYEALLAQQVANRTLAAVVPGMLLTWQVQEGESVRQGDVLAKLHNPELDYQIARAQADLQKQEAVLLAAAQNLDAGELQQVRLRVEQAELALELYRQRVENLIVKAPRSGILRLLYSPMLGEQLSLGRNLASISGTHQSITVDISEMEIDLLQEGLPARVEVNAFPEEIFSGIVSDIAHTGTAGEAEAHYAVTFDLVEDERLKSGMSATVSVVLREAKDVLAVPVRSLRGRSESGEGYLDLYIQNTGKTVETRVSTGYETKEMIEITRGLQEGDIIVVSRAEKEFSVDDLVNEWLSFIRDVGSIWWR